LFLKDARTLANQQLKENAHEKSEHRIHTHRQFSEDETQKEKNIGSLVQNY
jgi:hypothetical protein